MNGGHPDQVTNEVSKTVAKSIGSEQALNNLQYNLEGGKQVTAGAPKAKEVEAPKAKEVESKSDKNNQKNKKQNANKSWFSFLGTSWLGLWGNDTPQHKAIEERHHLNKQGTDGQKNKKKFWAKPSFWKGKNHKKHQQHYNGKATGSGISNTDQLLVGGLSNYLQEDLDIKEGQSIAINDDVVEDVKSLEQEEKDANGGKSTLKKEVANVKQRAKAQQAESNQKKEAQ